MEIQDKIISHGEGRVIVSASAGCGKTTTMIRRIARLILERRCGADELLVVTFTNAAASEMREKLNRALKERNDGGYVLEQLYKLESADICTIDSFCSRLLKKYFYAAEVDPNFEIADSSESAMLKLRAAESVVAEGHESGDETFAKLADVFSGDRTDRELAETLMRLVDLSDNYSDREGFLLETLKKSCEPDGPAERYLLEDIRGTLSGAFERFLKLSKAPDIAESDAVICRSLCDQLEPSKYPSDVDGWRSYFESLLLPAAKPLKKAEKESPSAAALHERVKSAKDGLKKAVERLTNQYLTFSAGELARLREETKPLLVKLAELGAETVRRFDREKASRSMLDFGDVERAAFRILQDEGIRTELRAKYKYLFLDEAQDVNAFQEELLSLLAGTNEFLVGDVKQCIYRFRGAKPEIFAGRCRENADSEGFYRLSENFRTNSEILEFVNRVFSASMRGDFCSVDYASTEKLFGRKSGRIADGRPAVICNFTPKRERTKRFAEPLYRVERESAEEGREEGVRIAQEITELVCRSRILEDGAKREIRYSDVAVLVRGKKSFSDGIKKTLRSAGIPVSCDFEYPMFHYCEITMLVNYLRLVDNFRQDIPLAASLSGCFGNFTPSELAQIRLRSKRKVFSDAFCEAAGRPVRRGEFAAKVSDQNVRKENSAEESEGLQFSPELLEEAVAADPLREKCAAFLTRLEKFRARSRILNCFDLIGEIVRETGYETRLEREGDGKTARLKSFLASVENKAFAESLSGFLRFVDRFSDTFLLAEKTSAAESVLVTTIHKSKGLEYPVVFLAGLSGKFNRADAKRTVCVDPGLGGGLDFFDSDARTRTESPIACAVRRSLRDNSVRDELNLLYVAMTRAKYRLYLSGVRDLGEEEEFDVREAGSFLDVVCPALEGSGAEVNVCAGSDVAAERGPIPVYETELQKYLPFFSFRYQTSNVPVKNTVTQLNTKFAENELSRNLFEENGSESADSTKLNKIRGDSARNTGILYHNFLERGNISIRTLCGLESEIVRLTEAGIFGAEEAEALDRKKLLFFYQTLYASRTPSKVLREQPFLYKTTEESILPGGSGEEILVQGKIDLLLLYPDGFEVIDYKFSGLSESELLRKYSGQARIYCAAAAICTGLPAKGAYLYSFGLDRLVPVKI